MGLPAKTLVLLLGIFLVFLLPSGNAAGCWDNSNQASCLADTVNTCTRKTDQWGSWCEELNCWSLWNQSACENTVVPGKNCTWSTGSTYGWCQEPSCWNYAGTNETTCENNNASIACTWENTCQGSNPSISCWTLTTETSCDNVTGCYWGNCFQRSCSDYSTQATCTAAGTTGYSGNPCKWNTAYNYCYEQSCWENTNQSACDSNNCSWDSTSSVCSDFWCSDWDFTSEASCVNNTGNITCSWNSPYCNDLGCWSFSTESSCSARSDCTWTNWTTSGWCEQIDCWKWDSWNGGNKTKCEGNSTLYGLGCAWNDMPGGTTGQDGWCYRNFTQSTTCGNLTTEFDCLQSYYCFWNYGNSTCNDPTTYTFNNTVFNEWNPGCYVFDLNSTVCNNMTACNYTGSSCEATNPTVAANGLNCSYVNNSQLCNTLPVFSTCCSWEAGQCVKNQFSTQCWDQLDQPPAGATFCEDYNSFTNELLCNQTANYPWFMPCKWDNNTQRCSFKSGNVFGNESNTLIFIDNQRACEAAGGKWIIENYCEGNISVPAGRCEYKFDDETNCDKACFACDYKSDGTAHNSTAAARTACQASVLGYCQFKADSSAENSFGRCRAAEEIASGREGECSSDCGGCTYYGDPNAAEPSKRPKYYCENVGTNCKWVEDEANATDQSKGYCTSKSTITCENACDRCTTQSSCVNLGRKAQNATGSCSWNSAQETCSQGGESGEICWDALDNNADGLIDCADPSCYTDSFCGFVSGNCFGYTTQSTCESNSCEWVTDSWGSWCDFKGATCWLLDGNETGCKAPLSVRNESLDISAARINGDDINGSYNLTLSNIQVGWQNTTVVLMNSSGAAVPSGNYTVDYGNRIIRLVNDSYWETNADNITLVNYSYFPSNASCSWSPGTGSGWCEQDWSIGNVCFGANRSTCNGSGAYENCTFTNDTWCNGAGNGTSWCSDYGGWCEHNSFASQNCWQYDGNSTACNATSGCSWQDSEWPSCGVDWNPYMNCWQNSTQSSCEAAGCAWISGSGSSWCGSPFDACSNLYTEGTCTANNNCYWNPWGWCGAKCWQSNLSESSCNAISGCVWFGGWCSDTSAAYDTCTNSTNSNNQTACNAASSCKWHSPGWCDPAGFAGGGAAAGGGFGAGGMTCYKYDGNQSGCQNQTGCGWIPESFAHCSVDWSRDCWQYFDNSSCTSGGCYWSGTFCMNPSDQCWSDSTLQASASACNSNTYCDYTAWNTCEPSCFNQTLNQTSCEALTNCKWMNGWCNAAGTVTHFATMEAGAPVPLGTDTSGDAMPASVDILGFGMKDVGDAFAFGAQVRDFSNSSICNDVQLPTGLFGSGNDTTKFYVYLDTDGSTTGGCPLQHAIDTTSGYEFRFRYDSVWNSSANKADDTFNSFKCDNGAWKAADIKISTWKNFLCGEIGGPAITVEKSDLSKFPSLYNTSADMRVYVSTANSSTNVSSPADTAGPAWTSPGAIDFSIDDAFSYGANAAKFEDILKKGYVKYEDCFNGVDDDEDSAIDCSDYECEFYSVCTNKGVNVAGYTDTRAPAVTGVKMETYTDSALIMYDTNKPTNGSLLFYFNDSLCKTLNDTIHDVGIRKSSTVRQYKVWHTGEIYNDAGSYSLDYSLSNATTYFYKLKVCDNDGKCGISRCSNFTTSSSSDRCGYCNYVTRIKVPTGWSIAYDSDVDNIYEHIQGAVCGPNAGMKSNYTMGRLVNVYLNNSDNTTAFWFINASLTRTGLNDKVRTVNNASGFKNGTTTTSAGTTIGYGGMISEVRDKIINNLHPEVCEIKIPKGTSDCTQLWHCADNLSNCVQSTSGVALTTKNAADSTSCYWQLPFCEFSIWAGGQPGSVSPSSSSSSSAGGGGGGGGAARRNVTNVTEQPVEPVPTPTPTPEQPSMPTPQPSSEKITGMPVGIFESPFAGDYDLYIFIIVIIVLIIFGYFYYHGHHHVRKIYATRSPRL